MAAAEIPTLLKFEEAIEPVIASALQTAGAANVFTSHSADTLVTPSLSVSLIIGATNGHRFTAPAKDFWLWDQWSVAIQGVTRTNRGQNPNSHADYRALLRFVMLDIFTTINPLLEYHAFAELPTENGTANSVDEENNHDISIINFSSVLAIKTTAWPES